MSPTRRLCLQLALPCALLPWAGATRAQAGKEWRELTARAEAAFQTGDLIVAMGLFRRAADAGHAPAQARLADLLDAAEQDEEAVAWYRLAAAQNDADGEFGLGRMLAHGEGVKRDVDEALKWYRRAVQKNHVRAIEALARATRSGDLGLARNPAEANRLEQHAQALRDATKGRP